MTFSALDLPIKSIISFSSAFFNLEIDLNFFNNLFLVFSPIPCILSRPDESDDLDLLSL